jgi:putative membrane protein
VVRPFLAVLSCPLIILSMGLFMLVINAAMLLLATRLAGAFGVGFYVEGFWAAFWGAVVISIVSLFMNALLRDGDNHKHRR